MLTADASQPLSDRLSETGMASLVTVLSSNSVDQPPLITCSSLSQFAVAVSSVNTPPVPGGRFSESLCSSIVARSDAPIGNFLLIAFFACFLATLLAICFTVCLVTVLALLASGSAATAVPARAATSATTATTSAGDGSREDQIRFMNSPFLSLSIAPLRGDPAPGRCLPSLTRRALSSESFPATRRTKALGSLALLGDEQVPQHPALELQQL